MFYAAGKFTLQAITLWTCIVILSGLAVFRWKMSKYVQVEFMWMGLLIFFAILMILGLSAVRGNDKFMSVFAVWCPLIISLLSAMYRQFVNLAFLNFHDNIPGIIVMSAFACMFLMPFKMAAFWMLVYAEDWASLAWNITLDLLIEPLEHSGLMQKMFNRCYIAMGYPASAVSLYVDRMYATGETLIEYAQPALLISSHCVWVTVDALGALPETDDEEGYKLLNSTHVLRAAGIFFVLCIVSDAIAVAISKRRRYVRPGFRKFTNALKGPVIVALMLYIGYYFGILSWMMYL